MKPDVQIIDEHVDAVSEKEMSEAIHVRSMTDVQTADVSLQLTESDVQSGKALCKTMIQEIVSANLPESIKSNESIRRLVDMQSAFEQFSLIAMYSVVAQAVQVLEQLTVQDDIYTAEGMVDVLKLNAVLETQRHVMDMIVRFNTHVRNLPIHIINMIHDAEYNAPIIATATAIEESSKTTSKPMSQLLLDAEQELNERREQQEEQQEQVQVDTEPEQVEDESDTDDSTIELE